MAKLRQHDAEFKRNHFDLVDNDDTLTGEQANLDDHDDLVATLMVRLMALADNATRTSPREVDSRELLVRQCKRLESHLLETAAACTPLSHNDVCRLQQYQEQTSDFKKEIAELGNALLSLTLEESDVLPLMIADLEKKLLDLSLHLKEQGRI